MANFGLLFRGTKFSCNGYLAHHFLSQRDEIWQRWGLASRNLLPEFRSLRSRGPVIPCGDMHQSFTSTLVKWFYDDLPMFADRFSVLSIHCVTQRLGATSLYKCRASRSGSLRQHALLVYGGTTSSFSAIVYFLGSHTCNHKQ